MNKLFVYASLCSLPLSWKFPIQVDCATFNTLMPAESCQTCVPVCLTSLRATGHCVLRRLARKKLTYAEGIDFKTHTEVDSPPPFCQIRWRRGVMFPDPTLPVLLLLLLLHVNFLFC